MAYGNPAYAGRNVWTPFGPDGGDISALAIDPTSDDVAYALANGPLFKTTDGGATWQSLDMYGYSVAIDPANPRTIYLGSQDSWEHGILYKSVDGGLTWDAGVRLGDDVVQSIVIDPTDPRSLFAFIQGGAIGISVDAGVTWHTSYFEGPVYLEGPIALDDQADTLYVSGRQGVWRSTDRGVSWTLSPTEWTYFTTIIVDGTASGVVYAAGDTGVLRSVDHGVTWEPVNAGLPAGRIHSLAVDPNAPLTIYAGTSSGVFKSTNAGTEWLATGMDSLFVSTITVAPSGNIWAGHGSIGVSRSDDSGVTWSRSGKGFGHVPTTIYIDPLHPHTLYASSDGLFKSTDDGESWELLPKGLISGGIGPLAFHPRIAGLLYAGTCHGLFRSIDAGRTWQPTGLSYETLPYDDTGCLSSIAIDPEQPSKIYVSKIYVTGEAVWKTIDGGQTWRSVGDGLPQGVQAIVIDPHDSATLYARTDYLLSDESCGLFKSTDGGAHWGCIGAPGIEYSDIVADPRTPGVLYAAARYWPNWGHDVFPGGVLKSVDGGATWLPTSLGQPYMEVHVDALQIDPQRPRTLYAATWNGIFVTDDGGVSWNALTAGIGPWFGSQSRRLSVDGRSHRVYASTRDGGGFVLERVLRCHGDCSRDGVVTIDEVMRGVKILLGTANIETCNALDDDANARVGVDELVASVNDLLHGCDVAPPLTFANR